MGKRSTAAALALLAGLFLTAPDLHAQDPKAPVPGAQDAALQARRATMQGIFGALHRAFIVSLDSEQYAAPANRPAVTTALEALAANAEQLETHGQGLSHSYDFLRESLASDAREAARRYKAGEYESSRFVLHQVTENCFSCHSRLPATRKFDLGANFFRESKLDELPLESQVKLAVATRQFDRALAICEKIFRSSDLPATEIELMGAFEDYLKILIRVESDYGRATSALEQFSKRPDVPEYLQKLVEAWVESLRVLGREKPPRDSFERAKQLIKKGQMQNRFPADRRGLVYFVTASGLLHAYISENDDKGAALAEPYYLLGVAESYIGNSFWISETEFFLETAIRLAPGSPASKQAYAFLEDFTIREFTGSSGEDLPEDVQATLKTLRAISLGKRAEKTPEPNPAPKPEKAPPPAPPGT